MIIKALVLIARIAVGRLEAAPGWLDSELAAGAEGRCGTCPGCRAGNWAPVHAIHFDAQDEQVAVGCYHIGIGPAVVFDGGGFTDPVKLRAFIADLASAVAWLETYEEAPHAA